MKLTFELFKRVLEEASSFNVSIIIDINVDVCRALNADFLQNLSFKSMKIECSMVGNTTMQSTSTKSLRVILKMKINQYMLLF